MCINNSIQKYVNIFDSTLSKCMINNISIGFSTDMFWQVLYNECWFMLGIRWGFTIQKSVLDNMT